MLRVTSVPGPSIVSWRRFCLQGSTNWHRDRDFDCFEKVLGLRVVKATA